MHLVARINGTIQQKQWTNCALIFKSSENAEVDIARNDLFEGVRWASDNG